MADRYGVRENYNIAQQLIKDGLWRVDPIRGEILSARKNWKAIGTARENYVRVPIPVGGGKHRAVAAHRVIWEYVNGESDLGLTINHKNGDTQDNRINNLELLSNAGNTLHGHRTLGRGNGSRNKGESNPHSKLTEAQVSLIKCALEAGESGTSLSRRFNVSAMTISNIKHRVIWKDVVPASSNHDAV